jgi:hypothetical protein
VFVSFSALLLLSILTSTNLLLPIRPAFADSYSNGYNEGCYDAGRDLKGLNGHVFDYSVHHGDSQFGAGYVNGYHVCWNGPDNQQSQPTLNKPSPSNNGRDTILTVIVPHHPFGKSAVNIDILAQNGLRGHAYVSTASPGGASWRFTIPSNQGNSVQVCVDSGFLTQRNCHTYAINGGYVKVSLSAPG